MKSVYQKFLKKAEKEKAMAEIQNQIEEIFQKNEREYNVKVNIVNAFVRKKTFRRICSSMFSNSEANVSKI